MTIKEAFKQLSLPLEASEAEIREAHRALSRVHHPDLETGNNEIQAELNAAYEIACAYAKIKTAVMPIKPSEFLEQITKAIAANPSSSNANELARILERRRTQNLQWVKRISWGIGGINAIIALLGKDFFQAVFQSELSKSTQSKMALLAFIFGIVGLFFQLYITRIENKMASFLADISDKRICASRLAERLNYQDVEIIKEDDLLSRSTSLETNNDQPYPLQNDFDDPVKNLFPFLFKLDERLVPILLAKSKEHGIIEAVPQDEITPNFVQTYHLHFRPSLFKKEPIKEAAKEPQAPPQELPRGCTLTAALVMSAILSSLAIYLRGSNWGFFIGIFAGLSFVPGIVQVIRFFSRKKGENPNEHKAEGT